MMININQFLEGMRSRGYDIKDRDTQYESNLYIMLTMAKNIEKLEKRISQLDKEVEDLINE